MPPLPPLGEKKLWAIEDEGVFTEISVNLARFIWRRAYGFIDLTSIQAKL